MSSQIQPRGSYYYCYQCDSQKESVIDFKCPTCNSGFIELMEDQAEDRVENQVIDRVENQVIDRVENQVTDRVENQVTDRVENQVTDRVENQVIDRAEVYDESQDIDIDGEPFFQYDTFIAASNRSENRSENNVAENHSPGGVYRISPIRSRGGIQRYSPMGRTVNSLRSSEPLFRELWRYYVDNSSFLNGGRRGLTENEISALPSIVMDANRTNLDSQCAICLDNIELLEEIFQLACDHPFHKQCITHWLKDNGTCPVCRRSLLPPRSAQRNQYPLPHIHSGLLSAGSFQDHITLGTSQQSDPASLENHIIIGNITMGDVLSLSRFQPSRPRPQTVQPPPPQVYNTGHLDLGSNEPNPQSIQHPPTGMYSTSPLLDPEVIRSYERFRQAASNYNSFVQGDDHGLRISVEMRDRGFIPEEYPIADEIIVINSDEEDN